MKVVFSNRAMISLLVETKEKITTETGGVFLGEFIKDTCFIVEAVDPGPNSIFTTSYFEYDVNYVNHLINKLSRIYNRQLDLVGLWHRHPGSLDRFSSTDDKTNSNYAQLSSNGAISALVNIDPKFRLTVYHVTNPLKYEKVEYSVSDELIPKEIMELKDIQSLQKQLQMGDVQKKTFADILKQKSSSPSFGIILHKYFGKRSVDDIGKYNVKNFEGELPIENVLDELAEDLDAFDRFGIAYNMEMTENGLLCICGESREQMTWRVDFGLDNVMVVFEYKDVTYKYKSGLFSKILNDCVKR